MLMLDVYFEDDEVRVESLDSRDLCNFLEIFQGQVGAAYDAEYGTYELHLTKSQYKKLATYIIANYEDIKVLQHPELSMLNIFGKEI